jgi:hypothetical protein
MGFCDACGGLLTEPVPCGCRPEYEECEYNEEPPNVIDIIGEDDNDNTDESTREKPAYVGYLEPVSEVPEAEGEDDRGEQCLILDLEMEILEEEHGHGDSQAFHREQVVPVLQS